MWWHSVVLGWLHVKVTHLDRMKRIYGYCWAFKDATIRIRTGLPDFSDLVVPEVDWSKSVYAGAKEDKPKDAPSPRGNPVRLYTYADANLCHNKLNGKAVTAELHFINQTPFDWYIANYSRLSTLQHMVLNLQLHDPPSSTWEQTALHLNILESRSSDHQFSLEITRLLWTERLNLARNYTSVTSCYHTTTYVKHWQQGSTFTVSSTGSPIHLIYWVNTGPIMIYGRCSKRYYSGGEIQWNWHV